MTPLQRRILKFHSQHFTVSEIASRAGCGQTMVRNTIKQADRLAAQEEQKPSTTAPPKSMTSNAAPSAVMEHLTSLEASLHQPPADSDEAKKKLAEAIKNKISYHLQTAGKLRECLETLELNGVI